MRRIVVLLALLLVLVGCTTARGTISVDTVNVNFEAVVVPYVEYLQADPSMTAERKEIRLLQIEKFRALIAATYAEKEAK